MIHTGKIKKAEIFINTGYLKLSEIKAKTGCDIVVNGGLFDMRYFSPYCHLKADGTVYVADEFSYWGYGWNTNDVKLMSDYSGVKNYIACVCLIRNGKPEPLIYNPDVGGKRERTAWGIKKDGTHVFFVSERTVTYTPEALQAFMMAQGCDSALMLDGGGSTQGIFPNGEVYSSRIVHNVICVWLDNPDGGKIIEPAYKWNGTLKKRSKTEHLILHHAAANGSAEDIHRYHVSLGWTGIGYHYYIRKDGSIYRGRPENTVGAHTVGYNDISIGVCFEGNFDVEYMSDAQRQGGEWLVNDIMTRYPNLKVGGHKDYDSTSCPGKHFSLDKKSGENQVEGKIVIELDTLRKGSRGKQVRNVQLLLGELGYQVGPLDGDFGPKTDAAVRKYQADKGLTADGIVGKLTWEKILK